MEGLSKIAKHITVTVKHQIIRKSNYSRIFWENNYLMASNYPFANYAKLIIFWLGHQIIREYFGTIFNFGIRQRGSPTIARLD